MVEMCKIVKHEAPESKKMTDSQEIVSEDIKREDKVLKEMCTYADTSVSFVEIEERRKHNGFYEPIGETETVNYNPSPPSEEEHSNPPQSAELQELKVMCVYADPNVPYEQIQAKHNLDGFYKPIEKETPVSLPINQIGNNVHNGSMNNSVINTRSGVSLMNNVPIVMDRMDNFSVGNYLYENNCLYCNGESFMNAAVKVEEVIDEGDTSCYVCKVAVKGRIYTKKIRVAEFTDGNWLKTIPGFAVHCTKSQFNQLVHEYLNFLINVTELKVEEKIRSSGWHQIEGSWYYVTPDGILGRADLKICSMYGQKIRCTQVSAHAVHRFLEMQYLTRNSPVALVLILYEVQSFSYSIFKEAGMVPKFVALVHGARGSYKTSLALAMTQIENRTTPKYTLKSTAAGLESGFREYKDAVMLIDDLAPVEDRGEKRRLENNLELIVRCYGDATGKRRNLDFNDKNMEQYKAEGGAIITGEYVSGMESSLARCLLLGLSSRDVDINLLSKVQKDDSYLVDFLVGYLVFISTHFNEAVQFVKCFCEQEREQHSSQYSNPRYAEYYSQLICAGELVLMYGQNIRELSQQEVLDQRAKMRAAVGQVMFENNRRLISNNPTTQLCRAVIWSIDQKMYKMINVSVKENSSKTIFTDEQFIYLQQPDLKAMKEYYDDSYGLSGASYSASTLAKLLVDAGVAVTVMEGKSQRSTMKLPGHGNVRFMKLDKKKLYDKGTPE